LTQFASLDLERREDAIISEVLAGNIPNFLRKLCPVHLTNVFQGATNTATCFVTPDYLCIGTDDDYFLAPVSPNVAQRLANALSCSLPTPKLVDAIYRAAEVKLNPTPIPPSPAMTAVAVFSDHNSMVRTQRAEQIKAHPLGALVGGHKKDVVITTRLADAPGKVAIYGWHRTNGTPIQPLYLGHSANWVDYSQCTRLILQQMLVNGKTRTLKDVLADPALEGLVSYEGVVTSSTYSITNESLSSLGPPPKSLHAFKAGSCFGEKVAWFQLEREVRVHINAPPQESFSTNKRVLLVFYSCQTGTPSSKPSERPWNPRTIGGSTFNTSAPRRGSCGRFSLITILSSPTLKTTSKAGRHGGRSMAAIQSPKWSRQSGNIRRIPA
jgi:hypothetical protein